MSMGSSETRAIAMIKARTLTFTFPDSLTSCQQPRGAGYSARPYHEQVFTSPEIVDVVSRHGFPDSKMPRDQRGADAFIEVHVWDDGPRPAIAHEVVGQCVNQADRVGSCPFRSGAARKSAWSLKNVSAHEGIAPSRPVSRSPTALSGRDCEAVHAQWCTHLQDFRR